MCEGKMDIIKKEDKLIDLICVIGYNATLSKHGLCSHNLLAITEILSRTVESNEDGIMLFF